MARPTYDPYFGKDKYNCDRCGDEWKFIPEDYDDPKDWPTTCPLCTMPITQMWHDVYEEEGLKGVVRQTLKRFRLSA